MLRILLDTNVLLVSIPKQSKYRKIFESLIQKRFKLIISNEVLSEYEEIIAKKTNQFISHNIVKLLLNLSNVEKVDIYYKWNLIDVDKDDNKFVDCAIAGHADYFISNDKHFDILNEIDFPQVTLLNIDEFLTKLIK